jgi:hypothetical protein
MTMTTISELCSEHCGEHYQSPTWRAAADHPQVDWSSQWPIVDGAGNLIGTVYDSGDDDANDDYANVDDLAMVALDDLSSTERRRIRHEIRDETWDGYTVVV